MADVEMKEATAGASAKGKGVSKGSEGASDGKKKFEVKKVRLNRCILVITEKRLV
jgi:RING-box protein 1